jgi:hypothetical protein
MVCLANSFGGDSDMDRKHLESAAASNHYLRGLLAIPLGVVGIAAGLGNMEWGPFHHLWVVPVVILLAGGAYALLARYYNDSYGRVTPQVSQRRAVGGSLLSVVVMGGGPVLVQVLGLPVNGIAVSFAAIALGYYAVSVGLRPHQVAIWGAVLVAGLVPAWPDAKTSDAANFGMLMVGAAAVVTGICDHLLLVRTFGPAGALDLDNSSAGA